MRILHLPLLIGFIALIACHPDQNTAAPLRDSEATSVADTDDIDHGFGHACVQPPSTGRLEIDEIENGEAPYNATNDTFNFTLKPDGHLCAHMKGQVVDNVPEQILVWGNQSGLQNFGQYLKVFISRWLSASATSHRHGCVYLASRRNLERLAQRKNIERIVFLGHGSNGYLLDFTGTEMIAASEVPTFTSAKIKQIKFVSCQAGQKVDDWRRVFSNSPAADLDMSKDNILVAEGLEAVDDTTVRIGRCFL